MSLLDKVLKKHVEFDPRKPEHLKAFHSVYFTGRQHPTLRFVLEDGYQSVVTMAQDKIIKQYFTDQKLA